MITWIIITCQILMCTTTFLKDNMFIWMQDDGFIHLRCQCVAVTTIFIEDIKWWLMSQDPSCVMIFTGRNIEGLEVRMEDRLFYVMAEVGIEEIGTGEMMITGVVMVADMAGDIGVEISYFTIYY